jgi:ATP-binding cassette, subfamily F, member 3
MIEIKEIEKRYGDKVLFSGCALRLGARDRLGLVGPNGSGKTTLLRIIAGEEQADRGNMILRRGVRIGFLSQEPVPVKSLPLLEEVQAGAEYLTLLEDKMRLLEEEIAEEKDAGGLEALTQAYGQLEEKYAQHGGYALEVQAKTILFGLGFSEQDLFRTTGEFSGGWLTRLALAKILLANPDLLLLDEPTNHLDLEALIWLEEFLKEYTGAVVVVSHDRDFLNRVATKIVSIERKKLVVYAGNYDSYIASRSKKQAIQEAALDHQQKKIEQTERFIERFRYKATKARQVQSRVKMLEKMDKVDPLEHQKAIHFTFPQPRRSGKVVVEMQGVSKAYGAVKVYSGIDFSLFREDKAALIGLNGAGKSTLLKLLAQVLEPDGGKITWGHHVTTGYFAQHQLELLDPTQTVWEEIFSLAQDEPVSFLRGLLGAFLFSGEEVDKKVSVLSGGEKSRLVLAKMLMRPANFLLLDEPSNHLDLAARAVLEHALREFQGTLCFITHDRHLINSVANKIIEVKWGKLTVYPGNYDDYLYKKEIEKKAALNGLENPLPVKAERKESWVRRSKEQKRLEAEVRNRFYREIQDLRQKILGVEALLDEANQEVETLAHRLADPEVYRRGDNIAEILKVHAEAKKRTEKYTAEWEELSQRLEEMEKEREAQIAALIA